MTAPRRERGEPAADAATSRRNAAALLLAGALAFLGSAALPPAGRALHAVLVVMLGATGVLLVAMAGHQLVAAGRGRTR
jgi:hypothetical protein